jgi:glyoxylase-like metal-dependent hydrolase (beta-lactamase superfamily II)
VPQAETQTEVLHTLLDRHLKMQKGKGVTDTLPEKGYVLKTLGQDVYFFSNGTDGTLFVVVPEGVVLVDPLRGSGRLLAQAIREVTPQPVKYIIYSTHEARHIGDAYGFARGATIIAQRQTAERLKEQGGSKIPAPQLTFGTDYTLRTDSLSLELHHIGGKVNGETLVFVPEKKVVLLPDRALPHWVPHLEDGERIDHRVMVLERLNEMEFTAYVPGHGDRPGTRDDLQRTVKFYKDGYRAFRFAVMRVFGANAWEGTRLQIPPKALKEKYNTVARECYRLLAMNWAGNLNGFRELAPGHCRAWFQHHLPAKEETAPGHS